MFWSKTFIPTLKEAPQEAESITHQLMLRAGLIRMLMSGVYSYLPLGLKVLNNIETIIRQEMDASGAQELLLPALQPDGLWVKTGRDKTMADVIIKFVDRRGRKIFLGPTHEEVITELVKDNITSYKQLPLVLYQIQTKFRDEIRPRFGLVRGCEFIMKDAYSFDKDQAGLDKNYKIMFDAYNRIFKRCGLECMAVEADSGAMGGSVSHEFMVAAREGEDAVLSCPACKTAKPVKEEKTPCPECGSEMNKVNTLEVGHIFQLGTKYSLAQEANFTDEKGAAKPVIMGCYGIGVSRLFSAIIEQNHDKDGIIWPVSIAPYKVAILVLDPNEQRLMTAAGSLYGELQKSGIDTIVDDRDERAGIKFKDADLIGFSLQIILGKEFLKNNGVELKARRDNKKSTGTAEEILHITKEMING